MQVSARTIEVNVLFGSLSTLFAVSKLNHQNNLLLEPLLVSKVVVECISDQRLPVSLFAVHIEVALIQAVRAERRRILLKRVSKRASEREC